MSHDTEQGSHSGPQPPTLTLKSAGAGKVRHLHREGLLSKSIQTFYFIDVHQLSFCRRDPTTIKTAPEEEMGSSPKPAANTNILTQIPELCAGPGLWGWRPFPPGTVAPW